MSPRRRGSARHIAGHAAAGLVALACLAIALLTVAVAIVGLVRALGLML